MLVQYKDPAALQGYCPMARDIMYRVLAIRVDLTFGRSEAWALLWDPSAKGGEAGIAYPWFVRFKYLELVESTVPDGWSTYYHNEQINAPTLVHGFAELSDQELLIRVHDLNTEDADDKLLLRYLVSYGGNIKLTKPQNRMRSDEYLFAEAVIIKYRDELSEYYQSRRDWEKMTTSYEEYCDALRVVARTIVDRIAQLESPNSQRIFLEQLRGFLSSYGGRSQTGDSDAHKELDELKQALVYPYDDRAIVDRIHAKGFEIQELRFRVHKPKPR